MFGSFNNSQFNDAQVYFRNITNFDYMYQSITSKMIDKY